MIGLVTGKQIVGSMRSFKTVVFQGWVQTVADGFFNDQNRLNAFTHRMQEAGWGFEMLRSLDPGSRMEEQ